MRRTLLPGGRRANAATALAVIAILSGAACGTPTEAEPTFAEPADVPFGLLEQGPSTTSTTEPPAPEIFVDLCLTDGTGIQIVTRGVAAGGVSDPLGLVRATASPDERARGLRTALFADDMVSAVRTVGGVAFVDLTPLFQSGSGTDQQLAIAQIVCTLTLQPGIGQVTFTVGGAGVEVPRGDGSLTANAVSRDDYATLISRAPA